MTRSMFITKVMATTQAMMMLVYQGLIDVDEPVATYASLVLMAKRTLLLETY